MNYQLQPLIRGNRWSWLVGFEIPDFDWTGVAVASQIRARDGRLVLDLAATSRITTSLEEGVYKILLDVPGTVTALWTGMLTGDIRVSRSSPAFGPYTPVSFEFEVRSPATR